MDQRTYRVWDTDSGERSAQSFVADSPREAAHKSVFETMWPDSAGSISVSVRDENSMVHVFRVDLK